MQFAYHTVSSTHILVRVLYFYLFVALIKLNWRRRFLSLIAYDIHLSEICLWKYCWKVSLIKYNSLSLCTHLVTLKSWSILINIGAGVCFRVHRSHNYWNIWLTKSQNRIVGPGLVWSAQNNRILYHAYTNS